MRAQILTAFGGPENFQIQDVPKPELGAGKVLVRIAAASINQIDTKIREGLPVGPPIPAVLGADMAGIVEAVGSDVSGFQPGDEVYGLVGGVRGYGGTLAEYIAAEAPLLAHKPRTLSLHEAAALPLVALTAWDALERAELRAAEHVLVHGGAGGVGHVGVQLAKARGARVATTVQSDEDGDLARSLGADDVINFRQESVESYVHRLTNGHGFAVVFDTVGGRNLPNSFNAAAAEGRVVTTDGRVTIDIGPMHAKALSLSIVFVMLPLLSGHGQAAHGRSLAEIAKIVDAGRLRPIIDPHPFTLDTLPDAHRLLASGHARGKLVIDILPRP
jgi:NADPH2:quinone reductase